MKSVFRFASLLASLLFAHEVVVAQREPIPCRALANVDIGDTIDVGTGEKRAALLAHAKLLPLGGGEYKPSQSVEIDIKRLDDQSQLFKESSYSSSVSARGGLFRANFQMSGSGRQAATRTSQYVVATALWRQSALLIDRAARKRVGDLVTSRLGSHVVTGLEYGGELKIIIEMIGASWSQAESVSARLSASGFGAKAGVGVDKLVSESGFKGSLALHFVQNGGPEFKMPSLDTLGQQVFDWANRVKEQPTPMNLLIEPTDNLLKDEEVIAWRARSQLLREYSRVADALVFVLESSMTDKVTIDAVARNHHLYEPKEWVKWRDDSMGGQVKACRAVYQDAISQMEVLVAGLEAGKLPKVEVPTYDPPRLPSALEGPLPTELDGLRTEIDALKAALARLQSENNATKDAVFHLLHIFAAIHKDKAGDHKEELMDRTKEFHNLVRSLTGRVFDYFK